MLSPPLETKAENVHVVILLDFTRKDSRKMGVEHTDNCLPGFDVANSETNSAAFLTTENLVT